MRRRVAWIALPCSLALLGACSNGSSSRDATARSKSTTTALPLQTTSTPSTARIDGTGTALLFHSGPHGFVLVNGKITSPLLGQGKFQEKGTFGARAASGGSTWTATATFTAADGDTVRVRSVGGVRSFDKNGDPRSATTETITGGTGRYAGATGSMATTGITTVRQATPTVALQTYTFTFDGTITTWR